MGLTLSGRNRTGEILRFRPSFSKRSPQTCRTMLVPVMDRLDNHLLSSYRKPRYASSLPSLILSHVRTRMENSEFSKRRNNFKFSMKQGSTAVQPVHFRGLSGVNLSIGLETLVFTQMFSFADRLKGRPTCKQKCLFLHFSACIFHVR